MLTLPGGLPPAPRGALARALEFARPWAATAAGSLSLLTLGLATRRRRAELVDLASRRRVAHASREPVELPAVPLESLLPDAGPIDVRAVRAVNGNVSERELVVLCRLTRARAPRAIFEFGTFDGRTTLNLAANAPAGARVWTLDLPRAALGATAAAIDPADVQYADKAASGQRFRGSDVEGAITQLLGDSGTFDYAPYRGRMELVFVDASHAYEYVVNDSLQAITLLAPSGGTIVWHDYAGWDGVTRALNQLRRLEPRFAGLRWIEGTTLAVLQAHG